jgi:hypothetical protein
VTVEPSLEEAEASVCAFCRLSGRQVHGPLSLIGYESGGSAITRQFSVLGSRFSVFGWSQ